MKRLCPLALTLILLAVAAERTAGGDPLSAVRWAMLQEQLTAKQLKPPLPRGYSPLPELTNVCKGALIATLTDVGKPELGPPGAADYKSKWKIEKVLRGDYDKTTEMGFRVQNIPEEKRDRSPSVGKTYILVTYGHNENQIAAILEADEANISKIAELLKR